MRRTGFIIAGCFLLFQCQIIKAQQKNDWERENLKGRVKEIKEASYNVIHITGKIQKDSSGKINIIKFDSIGNIVDQNTFSRDGVLIYSNQNKYDNSGNRIEEVLFAANTDYSNYFSKTKINFDHKGNKTEEITCNIYDRIEKRSIFDNSDTLIIEYNYFPEGHLNDFITYKYDLKGNQVEKKEFYSDSILKFSFIRNYNRKGQMIEERSYIDSFGLNRKTTFTFLFKGKIKVESLYNQDNSLENRIIEVFNRKGDIIELKYYGSDSIIILKVIFEYDKKNNLIVKKQYDKTNNLVDEFSYKYIFDKKGNWVECIEYRNEYPLKINERQIIYY